MKKLLTVCALALFSSSVFAGGWTSPSVPTKIEVVRGQGFLIFFDLSGNPSDCVSPNSLWVPIEHPQYDILYSTVLTAFTAGKKLHGYSHGCKDIGWHGGTFNELNGAGALYISH